MKSHRNKPRTVSAVFGTLDVRVVAAHGVGNMLLDPILSTSHDLTALDGTIEFRITTTATAAAAAWAG